MIAVGDKVVSQPGAGQPKITGEVVEIEHDRAKVKVTTSTGLRAPGPYRWRSLKHLTRLQP